MNKYETMAVLNPDLDDDGTEAMFEKISDAIEDNDGEIVNVDNWGVKELAYEINDLKSGYYLVINFEGENKTLDKLNRVYNISDDVMRSLLLRAE